MKLTRNLNVSKCSAKEGKSEPMKQRNICILYGFLAEKLAGEFYLHYIISSRNKNVLCYHLS